MTRRFQLVVQALPHRSWPGRLYRVVIHRESDSLREEKDETGHHKPNRPKDVANGVDGAGWPQARLLKETKQDPGSGNEAKPAQPRGEQWRMSHCCRDQYGPKARKEISKVFADGDASVSMKGLEDDYDSLASTLGGIWRRVFPGKMRDNEGPPNQTENLNKTREEADSGCSHDEKELIRGQY